MLKTVYDNQLLLCYYNNQIATPAVPHFQTIRRRKLQSVLTQDHLIISLNLIKTFTIIDIFIPVFEPQIETFINKWTKQARTKSISINPGIEKAATTSFFLSAFLIVAITCSNVQLSNMMLWTQVGQVSRYIIFTSHTRDSDN